MAGWIKIHRQLRNHWLWRDDTKFKWWIDILLTVNYEERQVLIGGKVELCKVGQCVMSLESWAQQWRTTKKTVSAFFKLLELEKMIMTENLRFTTRLTVCNYESYQEQGNEKETPRKRRLPSTKEGKKERSITLPFNSENFADKWEEWKKWKAAEKLGVYKSSTGEQQALTGLKNLSGDNEQMAIAIIDQSMMNGWKGLFPLKAQQKLNFGSPALDEKANKEIFG